MNRSFFVFISAIAIYTAAVFMQDEHKIASVPEMKATVSEKEPAPPKSAVPEIQTRNPSQTL